MGTEVTGQDPFCGLLIADERFSVANLDASGAQQAGPRPGVPALTAGLESDLVLEASGEQTTTSYEVQVVEGGMPDDRAEVIFRKTTDSGTEWKGWNASNYLQEIRACDDGTAIPFGHSPDVLRLDDGRVLAVANISATLGGGSILSNRVYTYDPTNGWARGSVLDDEFEGENVVSYAGGVFITTFGVGPCLFKRPDGKVFCLAPVIFQDEIQLHLVEPGDIDNLTGTGWKIRSRYVLPDGLDPSTITYGQIRAAYVGSTVVLLIHYVSAGNDYFLQYASSDDGCSFILLDDWSTAGLRGRRPSLATLKSGVCVLAYYDTTGTVVKLRWITNAFEAFSDARVISITAALGTGPSELCIALDETGYLPYFLYNHQSDERWFVRYPISLDPSNWADASDFTGDGFGLLEYGSTNAFRFGSYYEVYNAGASIANCGGAVAVCAYGEILLLGSLTDTTAAAGVNPSFPANGPLLHALHVAGWANLTHPTTAFGTIVAYGYNGVANVRTSWAVDNTTVRPTNFGWTLTGTAFGAPTFDATSGVMYWPHDFSGGAGNGRYSITTTDNIDNGVVFEFSVRVQSGGSLTADDIVAEIRAANGTADYHLKLRFTTTQYRVIDANGGGGAGSTVATVTAAMGSWQTFKIALRHGRAYIWRHVYQAGGYTTWTLDASTTTLTNDGATPAANNLLQFGHVTSTTAHSRWRFAHYVFAVGSDELKLTTPPTNPTHLRGRRLSTSPVYADAGLHLAGKGGPARRAHTWTIAPRYDYGAENLCVTAAPSPADEWRATSDSEQLIVFDLGEGANLTTLIGVPFGVLLLGANFRQAMIEGWTGAAWVTLGTGNSDDGFRTLRFVRSGNVVTVPTSGSGSPGGRYLKRNELAGSYFDFGDGNIRKIIRNSEGAWRASANTHRPRLWLEGVTGAESAGSGVGSIIFADQLLIVHDVTTAYIKYRLRIPAQDTAEEYLKLAKLVVGPIAIFGSRWSRGRIIETTPRYTLTEGRAGGRTVESHSAARRVAQVAWADPVDHTLVQASTPDPDFLRSDPGNAASEPIATRHDVADLVEGLLDEIEGPKRLVVYLPSIPARDGATTTHTLTDRNAFLYGRVLTSARREQVEAIKQTDLSSEVFRVTQLVIEGEI